MRDWKGRCHRCGKETPCHTMSYFNFDLICADGEGSCDAKERAHSQFQEARDADAEATRRGDFNFPGIGKPKDL